MISARRVWAVVKKDIHWSCGNLKLLSVMLVPVIMIVLFSMMEEGLLFTFSMVFISAFVGLFTTSYLVMEEKHKGTLVALLTTPLRNHELLIAKFVFGTSVCLVFSLLAIITNGRIDLLFNPISLFSIISYSGMLCFLGYTMGVFFKNEQEMSVLSPLILFVFILSDPINKASDNSKIKWFFPDYHFSQSISDIGITWSEHLFHAGFNFIFFLGALLFASAYTKFFFSNQREKRVNAPLLLGLVAFVGVFFVSGFISSKVIKSPEKSMGNSGMSIYEFKSDFWSGNFGFDSKAFKVVPMIEMRNNRVLEIVALKDSDLRYLLSIKKKEKDENNLEKRAKKFKESDEKVFLSESVNSINGVDYKLWKYFKKNRLVFLAEAFCSDQLLQVSVSLKEYKFKNIKELSEGFETLLNSMRVSCLKTKD